MSIWLGRFVLDSKLKRVRLATLQNRKFRGRMMKLLYVDVPFANIAGGDTNRSSFIWSELSRRFEADLLLIKTEAYRTKAVPEHVGFHTLYTIASKKPPIFDAQAIHSFHPKQLRKYRDILANGKYDIIVFRFLSTFQLANIAAEVFPQASIAIDVDMLFSRIAELSWTREKCLKNRYHLIEMMKLKEFEATAFSKPFHFFFTNILERDLAISSYGMDESRAYMFPNMMPEYAAPADKSSNESYILFFGTLNSIANTDAVDYLMQDIYPAISSMLRDRHIRLKIVGKNPPPRFLQYTDANVEIVGPVEDIRAEIANAMFVVLPIRVASGTRTRILEAAETKTAVISTSIGAEGLNFNDDEVMIADNAPDFAQAILTLAEDAGKRHILGENLHNSATERYSASKVGQSFTDTLMALKSIKGASRRTIAIITNRFYPEVGGAETNIFMQATLLAKEHDITVFCPQRLKGAKKETIKGVKVRRLNDIIQPGNTFPKQKSKTFCPSLAFHLLVNHYDIIQCFPALNYNNIMAWWIAKLKGTPYILCFFDFIDYAEQIKKHGKIDPDILTSVRPKFYQLPVLKGMNHAFAIANKEISFLKQYNEKVSYSPVPILPDEYRVELPRPTLMKSFSQDAFVFLCLGRVSYIKGQDIALKAFIDAADDMPGAHLVIVGRQDYEPDFYRSLCNIYEECQCRERIHFTGVVERKEVLSWLRYSNIHVIPVRFMNSGAVVVESWASDTPVLQSDVVDPNLVEEGKNGYLFHSESVQECAEKMLLAYQENSSLADMAKMGKELVFHMYTYDYLINLYNTVYDSLLN